MKFEPAFLPSPYKIVEVDDVAKKLTVKLQGSEEVLVRHPDHVKPLYGGTEYEDSSKKPEQRQKNRSEMEVLSYNKRQEEEYDDGNRAETPEAEGQGMQFEDGHAENTAVRRSMRERRPNSRYANGSFELDY